MIWNNKLGYGARVVIICEAIRMILKIHSYLRNKLLYGT